MNTSRLTLFLFLGVLATALTGCDAIGTIFKTGFYGGIIAVVVVVLIVLWLVNKMRSRT
ncbi:hypothetical protein [Hymenobacter sp. IS2118]|uniref:hypothetical protein n=1 Tax=Hymenobacter sp. IS2118 TaxID=1505605 RepID=UPI00190F1B44|nr:hypothetical protein [Hymenobacter sp. IS2118]